MQIGKAAKVAEDAVESSNSSALTKPPNFVTNAIRAQLSSSLGDSEGAVAESHFLCIPSGIKT